MKLKRKERPSADLDVTSFSDIANLLIIFFILTTSLARPYGKLMEMPSASTPPQDASKAPKIPSINVMADRVVYTEGDTPGRELTMTELNAQLLKKQFTKLDPKQRLVVLEVAEDVEYDRYFRIVTMISSTGGVVAMVGE